ncbi:hypothetical protein M419DRAFT_138583 [Trichoderma reesei RUT C-30]|uniref:Uncharacterized protein n=1 Tax=Hypocrea jecorina (strain ATCC 56765 / BCRC 32924 / NRRL 11460 / Rut C-30) TaxID=1344414 RepID=A0A024S4K5_HYPJR|nr:hypothetical protein M419DRAFT_138583 [Trichoderma reesei RUT C-30]
MKKLQPCSGWKSESESSKQTPGHGSPKPSNHEMWKITPKRPLPLPERGFCCVPTITQKKRKRKKKES